MGVRRRHKIPCPEARGLGGGRFILRSSWTLEERDGGSLLGALRRIAARSVRRGGGSLKFVAGQANRFARREIVRELNMGVASSRQGEHVAAHGREDPLHFMVRAAVEADAGVAGGLVGSGEGGVAIARVHGTPAHHVGHGAVLEGGGRLGACRRAGEGDLVGPLNLVLRVRQFVHEGAVGGPQQEAGAVEVESSHRPEFGAEGVVGHEGEGGGVQAVFHRCDDPHWLVREQVQLVSEGEGLAIEQHLHGQVFRVHLICRSERRALAIRERAVLAPPRDGFARGARIPGHEAVETMHRPSVYPGSRWRDLDFSTTKNGWSPAPRAATPAPSNDCIDTTRPPSSRKSSSPCSGTGRTPKIA